MTSMLVCGLRLVEDGLGWVCLVLLVVFWLYEP